MVVELTDRFEPRRGRPPKYPWTAEDAQALNYSPGYWTDGGSRTLYRGRHFDADLISFRTMIHRKARDLGPNIGAHTKINKTKQSIEVFFYERSDSE